ncbi:MAG TPA: carboxypeptidase-like regulatory domain-containing protein [Candidatus Kapabacteria bacterium]|jgi:hypothetical protein|nr:carboxypeptidase-like regulatory domain-containing protein [Candidatus Kapabacteria bacterium]
MKQSQILFAFFTLALVCISGCTTNTTVTEVQPASTGRITGNVFLYEMDGSPSKSYDGVKVNIIGTNINAVSDSSGYFVLDSVPAGYYSIRFSKPGFSDYIFGSFEFVGAGTLRTSRTGELNRIVNWITTIPQPTITKQTYGLDTYFVLTFDPPSISVLDSTGRPPSVLTGFYYVGFVGTKPVVNYSDTSSFFYVNSALLTGLGFSFKPSNRIYSGDTIYLVVYPNSYSSNYKFQYYEGDTSKIEYTGLGPSSNTLKIVLP